MKNKEFNSIDKLAKEALENYEANFDPLEWLEMEQQLDASKSIDQLAKQALGDYEISFAEKDWLQFEQYRKQKKKPVPFVPWLKSAEIGLLVLFILTFTHYLPSKNTPKPEKTPTHSPKVKHETLIAGRNSSPDSQETTTVSSTNTLNTVSNTVLDVLLPKATPLEITEPFTGSASKQLGVSKIRSKSTNKQTTKIVLPTNDSSNGKDILNSLNNKYDSIIESSEIDINTKKTTANRSATETGKQAKYVQKTTIEQYAAQLKINCKTKALQLLLPVHLRHIPLNIDPIFNLKSVQLTKSIYKKVYLGGLSSLSANIENELGGSSIGYGAGFSFDIDFGAKFGLRTAFMFRSKQYRLSQNYTLPSNTLDNVFYPVASTVQSNLVVLAIPLDFQYAFFRSDKWKIFATAGIEANFIASRTYRGSEKTTFNGLTLTKDIQNNQFNRGFVEGGQFIQNAYLSLGGGIGLERQLGDRLSIYMLPVYRHAVTAVDGVYIHSFNFNIGLRTSL